MQQQIFAKWSLAAGPILTAAMKQEASNQGL